MADLKDQSTKEKDDAARRAQQENAAQLEGARSVVDAIKSVADDALAQAARVKSGPKPELTAAGTVGGKITVIGEGFGPSGTLFLNGAVVKTNGWSTRRIEGTLPADARSGEVVVWVDPDTQRRGYLTL